MLLVLFLADRVAKPQLSEPKQSAVIRAVSEFASAAFPLPRRFIVTSKSYGEFFYVQISKVDYRARTFDTVRWSDVLRSYSFNEDGRLISVEIGPGKGDALCQIPSTVVPKMLHALWKEKSPRAWLGGDFDIGLTLYRHEYGVMLSSLKRIVGSYQLYFLSKDLKQFRMINGY